LNMPGKHSIDNPVFVCFVFEIGVSM
jgi:hypothetical protein